MGRHKVGDFNTWLKGHQDRVELFSPSVSSFKTYQDTDDPNSIVLVLEVTDMEKFKAMLDRTDSIEAQKRHTVLKPITVSMPVNP
ncbi:hypothetical protein H4O20_03985 [Aequorivita sp. 609]|nr:hypothetical protein [Aequorivita sp. 609]